MNNSEQVIREIVASAKTRADLWVAFIRAAGVEVMLEVGVSKGLFASSILQASDALRRYYMIDPWRNLETWNAPANVDDDLFEKRFREMKAQTAFAAEKRVILRGKTTEVIEEIPEGSLDFAYIDGDHTLRGITIDLVRVYPKVRDGGWIGGDNFRYTAWQNPRHEPNLVFPLAVYFADAVGARIYALPYRQFLFQKSVGQSFAFADLTGHYGDVTLRNQFRPGRLLLKTFLVLPTHKLAQRLPSAKRLGKKVKWRIWKR